MEQTPLLRTSVLGFNIFVICRQNRRNMISTLIVAAFVANCFATVDLISSGFYYTFFDRLLVYPSAAAMLYVGYEARKAATLCKQQGKAVVNSSLPILLLLTGALFAFRLIGSIIFK